MKRRLLMYGLVLCSVLAYSQRTITGVVTDDTGEGLIGASVLAEGTNVGTITDFDGTYSIDVPDDATSLLFTYTGYQEQRITIGASDVIDVVMQEGVALDEVVVVAYGEQSKRSLTSSISTIDAENISRVPAIGPQEVLQGQVSGVQMVNSSGVLGAAPSIRIRGVASLTAGGSPLFVVDGVPLNDDTDEYSNDFGGSTGLNPLMNISTSDIENITVLKDASAAALYGSRGSNGVVLITTKKGKAGTNNINFNTSYGFGDPTKTFDMMNAQEYYETRNRYTGTAIPDDLEFFDWKNAVLQQAQSWRNSLSMSGGNQTTQYYVGGTYNQDENYTIGNTLDNISGRVNLTHRIGDNFKLGANVNVSHAYSDRISVENSTFAPLTSSYLQNPTVSAFNDDGSYARTGFIANVLAIEALSITDFLIRRTTGNVYAQYSIPNVLGGSIDLKSDFGIDNFQSEETRRDPELISPGGYGYHAIRQDNKWLNTNTLNFKRSFNNMVLGVVLGQSFETSRFTGTTVEGNGFAADGLRNVSSAATPTITSASRTEWALASFFSRATLDIDNKYFINASFRRDGSSRFGANNRWGNFWAVGAGWDITQEAFMADQDIFDRLKLRASYGVTGNDRIDNFQSLGLFQAGVESDYAGNAGLRPTQPQNADLKWEETAQFDVGVNMEAFDFLRLEVSYYNKRTTDLLLGVPLAYTGGITNITRNVGEMVNSGVDIDFGFDVMKKRDWNITVGGNISFLNNEIKDLGEDEFIASTSQRAVVGRSANEFFLIRYNGINPQTGNAEWLDVDGNPTTSPTSGDRVFVGSAIPDFVGGLNFNVNYKAFTLSGLFNYSYGNMIMLDGLRFTENPVSGFNKSRDLLNYWRQPGDNAFAPGAESATASSFAQRSTLQLQDGSFMRLKNLTLSYQLPSNTVKFIKNMNIYVRGINLLTWTTDDFRGQDPEVSDSGNSDNLVQGESFFVIPQRQMTEIGLNIQF